jgi:hypothetical protein
MVEAEFMSMACFTARPSNIDGLSRKGNEAFRVSFFEFRASACSAMRIVPIGAPRDSWREITKKSTGYISY